MNVRTYELSCTYPGFGITNRTIKYRSGDWILKVKAKSIKQAYYFAANQIMALENKGLGIIEIDNSLGPSVGWPWKSKTLYPKHWESL